MKKLLALLTLLAFLGSVASANAAEMHPLSTGDTVVDDTTAATYMVSVTVNDTLMGTVIGSGVYNHGDTAVLRAYPNEQYVFVGFNGARDGVDSILLVVTSDVNVTATFISRLLDLYYISSDNGSVSININGVDADLSLQPVQVVYNDSLVLTALPDTHYHLDYWELTDIEYRSHPDSTVDTIRTSHGNAYTNPYGMRAPGNLAVHAVFVLNTYTVSLSGQYVTLTGAGIYHYGDSATVTATGTDFRHLVAWVNAEGDTVSTSASYTFVVTDDVSLVALTDLDWMHLEVRAEQGGTVTGSGDYQYGSMATLVAIPDSGYNFIKWNDGDTNAVRNIYLYENMFFTATFSRVGIDDVDLSNVVIFAADRAIIVQGAAHKPVRVFDAVGRELVATVSDADMLRLPMEAAGTYLVQIGNTRARRVVLIH